MYNNNLYMGSWANNPQVVLPLISSIQNVNYISEPMPIHLLQHQPQNNTNQ
jgi:hypothetical protein